MPKAVSAAKKTSARKPAPKPAVKTTRSAKAAAAKPVAKPAARKRAAAAPAPAAKKAAAKPAKAVKLVRPAAEQAKTKLVRDSFTMPEQEYAVLAKVKQACLKAGLDVKKSELLRIGVALISQIDLATLQQVLGSLPQLKTGRPRAGA